MFWAICQIKFGYRLSRMSCIHTNQFFSWWTPVEVHFMLIFRAGGLSNPMCYEITLSSHHSEASAPPRYREKQQQTDVPNKQTKKAALNVLPAQCTFFKVNNILFISCDGRWGMGNVSAWLFIRVYRHRSPQIDCWAYTDIYDITFTMTNAALCVGLRKHELGGEEREPDQCTTRGICSFALTGGKIQLDRQRSSNFMASIISCLPCRLNMTRTSSFMSFFALSFLALNDRFRCDSVFTPSVKNLSPVINIERF